MSKQNNNAELFLPIAQATGQLLDAAILARAHGLFDLAKASEELALGIVKSLRFKDNNAPKPKSSPDAS